MDEYFNSRDYLIQLGGSAVASFAQQNLYDIQCYYEAMEAFIASSSGERVIRIRAQREKLPSTIAQTLLDAENSLLWEDYFPSELRASVLVSVMSFFELYLEGVCSEISLLLRTRITHKQLKGSAIERARTFLTELCALSRPAGECWDSMHRLQTIRNRKVHGAGILDTPQEIRKAQNLIEGIPGITCTEFGFDLNREFMDHAFRSTYAFLEEISAAASEACERVKRFENEA